MAEVKPGRWTAEIDGDFVVFLIGARADKRHLLPVLRDLGGRRGMLHMLQHLSAHPEKGLLGYEMSTFGGLIVQYWRSFEHLERFANDVDDPHVAAWRSYWRRVGSDAGPASGTRRTSCVPGSTRPSTATCRPSGWGRRPRW